MKRKTVNTIIFWMIMGFLSSLILYKIINVPITHDESATTVKYIGYSVWDIMMFPDNWPNNHILNTLLVKFFVHFLGTDQWVVRLPNLIGFWLFAWGVFRFIKTSVTMDSLLVIAATSLFVANGYLLDFFGLCRGYALATSLFTLGASYLFSGYSKHQDKDIWKAYFLVLLASYANFTLLPAWLAISGLCFLYFLSSKERRRSHIALQVVSGLGYLAIIFSPITKMTSSNQFVFWESQGFYQDTLLSLSRNWVNGNAGLDKITPNVITVLSISLLFVGLLIIIFQVKKNGWKQFFLTSPLILSFGLLGLTIFIISMQSLILDTPNLINRTALFLYPTLSFVLVAMLSIMDSILPKKGAWVIALILPLFMFWHLSRTVQRSSVRDWWFDANTLEVYKYLNGQENDTIRLKTNWVFYPSFDFYVHTGKMQNLTLYPYDKRINPNTQAVYYYVFEADIDQLDASFKRIKQFKNHCWLLKRKK